MLIAMNESVAVIIPTYNRANTLQRALDSVSAQTLAAQEICVVDDGSKDETRELVERNYPEVNYIRQDNQGVSAARNAGVKGTSSTWLAFLDSDDEWLPQKLELQLEALRGNPGHKMIHGEEIWIRHGKRVNQKLKHQKSGGYIFPNCLPLCVISPSAVMLDRELFSEMNGFDEALPACEDYDLWLRVCSQHEVLYLDTPLIRKYGGHADQLSRLHWGMDRFRVQALATLLESQLLDKLQRQLAISTLLQKLEILKNGALKREKLEVVRQYDELIEKYSHAELST